MAHQIGTHIQLRLILLSKLEKSVRVTISGVSLKTPLIVLNATVVPRCCVFSLFGDFGSVQRPGDKYLLGLLKQITKIGHHGTLVLEK